MTTYQELAGRLVDFEEFDPDAFVGDELVSQDLCNLFLAFALVYNDLRDLIVAHTLLSSVEAGDPHDRSSQRGLANGLRTVLTRAQCGLVHEFLTLVDDHRGLLTDPFFRKVRGTLSKRGKEAWEAVMKVASGRSANNPLAKALAILRNKVAFHYDTSEIGRGYRQAFFEGRLHGAPAISRGTNLFETRFYFADAAAQAYLFHRSKEKGARAFILNGANVFGPLQFALFELVTKFVQTRNYGWRRPPAQSHLGVITDASS